jgi:excinuclease ABC subunit C
MVVLQDGQPRPSDYRRFKVRSDSKDDFASMYEVLCRRLERARGGDERWRLPDLIVVDGGKAQLSMALAAMRDIGLPAGTIAPDVVGLAKERPDEPGRPGSGNGGAGEGPARPERVFLPGVKDPLALKPHTAESFLLTRVRDEAHRFAITYHKDLRRRQTLRSGLEDIPGIGPKRRRELLKHLGSLRRIRHATIEELRSVPGMSSRAAEAVAEYFAGGSAAVPPDEPEPALTADPAQDDTGV